MNCPDEPKWTVENQNRRRGQTNFESCGWCQHAMGTHRYDCCLRGSCLLFPDYDSHRDVNWDTKCLFKNLDKADINDFIDSKNREIVNLRESIKRTESEIEALKSLIVDDCPPLPSNRRFDHFNLGDRVWCYIYNAHPDYTRLGWISGTVCEGYRHQDGCVSFIADEPYHTNLEYHDGKGGGGGTAAPNIILDSEYEWFKSHPDRFKSWMKLACNHKFNGETIDPESIEVPR